MKSKIARRLTLYFTIVLLLFSLMASSLFSLLFARHTADITKRDLHAHAESIAETLSHFTQNYDQKTCQGGGFKAYMRFVGDFAMSDLFLLDAQCQSVTLGEESKPAENLPEAARPLVAQVFETGEILSVSADASSRVHADNLIAAAPVYDAEGRIVYVAVLCAPLNLVEHTQRDGVILLSICFSITMVLAIGVSVVLSHRFVTPLSRMMNTTTKLMQGEYSAKTGVHQHDEIGVLAEHIDELSLQLAAVEKERRQLDQMRQDFFSDISHELRTPIAVLKGSVELLREGMIQGEEEKENYYRQLFTDVTHLERLVNDLLELTRLQNPHFRIEKDVVNLGDILSESARFMRPAAAKKQITLHYDNPCNPFPVLGDYGRLRQMMIVLLDNAIKFSPEGSEVKLTAQPTKDGCLVCVTDHGGGMDEETLTHIFDRYFHNRSSLNRSGSGLGLPIAKEIALRHAVSITCESRIGEGTQFSLLFPEHDLTDR